MCHTLVLYILKEFNFNYMRFFEKNKILIPITNLYFIYFDYIC